MASLQVDYRFPVNISAGLWRRVTDISHTILVLVGLREHLTGVRRERQLEVGDRI
jgi:hypothetical protein